VRAWIPGAAGLVLVLLGSVGFDVARAHDDLSGLVVSSPAAGMVATAVGAGGAQPTEVLPAHGSAGIKASADVPTTPTIFLEPDGFHWYFGIQMGEQAAYWKVWWDASTQVKAVVSLQQHVNSAAAETELGELAARNSNIANFTEADMRFTSSSTLAVPGVPGATGYVWQGSEGPAGNTYPMQFRFAVFNKGSIVALVSMTEYSPATGPSAFLAFARSEYATMSASAGLDVGAILFDVVKLVGLGLWIFAIVLWVRNYRRKLRAPAGPPLAAAGQPDGW
jgi:hypothetical protein